ncbi:MAG: uncharacterized protein KVP18_001709 [Porospora cf. gigantea A]|nr:MAG: hypothetical protein KVP18_001709 [Porospora cf. gigantea A]
MRLHHAMVVTVPLFNKVSNYYAEPRHPKDTVHVSTHNRTFACSLHLGGVDVVVVKPTPMLLLENSVGMAKAFNLGLKTHIGLQIAVSEISNELNEATTALKELTDAAVDESLRLEEREDQILQFAAAVINSRSSPLEQIPEVSLPANPSVVDSWSDTSDEYAEPDLPLHTTSVGADDADIPLTSVAAGNADLPLHTTSVGAAPPHRDPIDWSSAEDSPPPKTCSAKQRMAALRKSRR